MGISITNRQRRVRLSIEPLRRRAEAILDKLSSSDKSIDIAIVGDRAMQALNRQFRNRNETTDVLSFPSGPSPEVDAHDFLFAEEVNHIGDIVVSLDEAQEQAEEDKVSLDVAIDRLIIHGCLHLHGFEHGAPAEATRMRRKENQLLKMLHGPDLPGYARPTNA